MQKLRLWHTKKRRRFLMLNSLEQSKWAGLSQQINLKETKHYKK